MAKKKPDDLDTETTFVDMNVDGFRWYDPSRKKKQDLHKVKNKVSRKEYWAMVKGAFLAILPLVLGFILVFSIIYILVWLWIGM